MKTFLSSPLANSLPHIEDVSPLSKVEEQVFLELRPLLSVNGLVGKYGFHLIHKHFDVDENEVFLTTVDTQTREIKVTVVEGVLTDVEQTRWTLSNDHPRESADFIKDLKQVIQKHGLLGKVGIHLLRDELELNRGEVLLEICDPKKREFFLTPISEVDDDQQTVTTEWDLRELEPTMWCKKKCDPYHPSGHVKYHDHPH